MEAPTTEPALIAFAVAGIVAHAKSLRDHAERLAFLRGCSLLVGDAAEFHDVRLLLIQMAACDEQLDFILATQLRLALSKLPT